MSDDYLKIIPTAPEHVPPKSRHQLALTLLETFLPDGEEFEAQVYDKTEFIDQGENIEAVICPSCTKRSTLDHSTDDNPIVTWWYDLAESMEDADVTKIITEMPCCRQRVRLMDIEFDWPAGFARFELNVMNPNVRGNLTIPQLEQLETILGCPLKQVRAHY